MTRFVNIPEHEDFFKALKLTLNNYSIAHGVTTYQHFAGVLHIKGNNASSTFSNLMNPGTGKDLKCREFITVLDNAPEHQKPTLDWLCNRYDHICTKKAENVTQTSRIENIKEILLNISGANGNLCSDFINFNSDNELTENELNQLLMASYQARVLLVEFENNIKAELERLKD